MNCRSAEPLFSSYVEDEISQEERRALEAHLMVCRRCAQDIRELRATMSLLHALPQVAPSRHFDDDVHARIRSGEGLRPALAELVREIFAPARLRPIFMAGAGVCALWIAVIVSPLVRSPAPNHRATGPIATRPAPTSGTVVAGAPAAAGRNLSARLAPQRPESTPVVASAVRPTPVTEDSIVDGQIPGQFYKDEIINDRLYLERGVDGQDPSVVPVNETADDGVFIIF